MILDTGDAPRRTLRVVLFANEEFGTDGEEQYARNHADAVSRHVIGLEADSGAGRVWRFRSQVAAEALDLIAATHALLRPLDIELGDNKASGGADLSSMRKAGMPVLELTHDDTHYFDYHHTPDDTLDKIDRDDINQSVAAYVTAAFVAANIEQDFGRLPTSTKPDKTCNAEDDAATPAH
jgi:Zn-dependent M28 family amino/carboxypeptidase